MAKAICIKGHYYDDEKYQRCPHCAAGMEAATISAFAVVQEAQREDGGKEKIEERRRLFGRKKEHQSRGDKGKGKHGRGVTENRTQVLGANGIPYHEDTEPNPCSQEAMMYGDTATQKLDAAYMVEMDRGSKRISTGEIEIRYPEKMPEKSIEREYPDRTSDRSVERSISKGENSAEGYSAKAEVQKEGKTIGYFSGSVDSEPPVGYLICIEGEDYGRGFSLKSGSNSLGRSVSMDVVIMDPKVSREKQAYIMYEPHNRDFFLKMGDSTGLCYLNDELVLEPKKLQAYDVILLGDTKLMLIPVCGEKFSW